VLDEVVSPVTEKTGRLANTVALVEGYNEIYRGRPGVTQRRRVVSRSMCESFSGLRTA
jgi:hypothetical protein